MAAGLPVFVPESGASLPDPYASDQHEPYPALLSASSSGYPASVFTTRSFDRYGGVGTLTIKPRVSGYLSGIDMNWKAFGLKQTGRERCHQAFPESLDTDIQKMIGSLLQRELIQKGNRPVFRRAYCPEDMSRLHYLTREQVSVLDSAWAAIADEALRCTHDLCSRHEGIKPFRTYTMERPDFAQLQDTEASDSSFDHEGGLRQPSESAYNTAPVVPYDMTLGTMASLPENQMPGPSAALAQDPFGVMDGSSFNTQFPIYDWPPLDGTAYLDDPSTWTVPS